jgi:hypothetical protein
MSAPPHIITINRPELLVGCAILGAITPVLDAAFGTPVTRKEAPIWMHAASGIGFVALVFFYVKYTK